MIDFENPLAFLFLLAFPVLLFLRYIKVFTPLSFPINLSDWNGSSFSWNRKSRKFFTFFANFLNFMGYFALVCALANPVKHNQKKIFYSRGSDIIFVVDISPSMASQDIAGSSRFEATKKAVHLLLDENSGSAAGLVLMAEEAVLAVPPTMDRNTFYSKLDSMTIGELGDGTAIGTGLSLATYHLESSLAPKKSIVLITDGENNSGSIHPQTAANFAVEKNISLYILGIGTKGTVHLEYTDKKTGHLYSGFYESNFDGTQLAELATKAGGKYFEVDSLHSLAHAFESVGKNENIVQTYQIKNFDIELYFYFVLAAIIIFAVAWIIKRIFLQVVI